MRARIAYIKYTNKLKIFNILNFLCSVHLYSLYALKLESPITANIFMCVYSPRHRQQAWSRPEAQIADDSLRPRTFAWLHLWPDTLTQLGHLAPPGVPVPPGHPRRGPAHHLSGLVEPSKQTFRMNKLYMFNIAGGIVARSAKNNVSLTIYEL